MTLKSSYEVFSLTFWRMKTSYDNLRAFPCYKISGNYVTFRALLVFFRFIKTSSRAKDVCGICSGKS